MRFNYFNSMMQRMNRAVGDAAEMTKILDEPRGGTYESLWDRQTGAFLEAE